ncbi:MAG TPA: toll/interleukin-1 receptor domain-containing protein [Pyrinomonadaceae bacterium]|nr:toll/interleukin-1 receptor domain-containing protein [Pyrinomonadaceae bacterium]
MSYLKPPFKHDIFLSYARVNNQQRVGAELGWVEQFRKDLMIELSELIGRRDTIDVWRDERELAGNQSFDEVIQNAIYNSGLFLACSSNGYLNPESYCLKELEWFGQRTSEDRFGKKVGTRGRLFNVLLNNVPIDQWPRQFEGLTGSKFNDAVDPRDPGYPLQRTDPTYLIQLRKLAAEIYGTLRDFDALMQSGSEEREITSNKYESLTVFLAHTADTLTYTTKERLLNDLRRNGAQIITDLPPRYPTLEHDEDLLAAIGKADLSVHLLDENPGAKVPDSADDFYPRRQADLVLDQPRPQFIWVPQTLDSETVPHKKYGMFLKQLENGERTKSSYRFVRAPAASVTREVFAALDLILKPPVASIGAAALVDTHPKDEKYAFNLSSILANNNVQPLITSGEDDPGKNIEGFEDLLRQVSLLIVVFGQVAEEWVTGRIREAFKVAAATEHRSLKVCGVYLPPREDGKRNRQLSFGLLPVSIPIFWFSDPKILNSVLSTMATS